jgi:hypothetical protein
MRYQPIRYERERSYRMPVAEGAAEMPGHSPPAHAPHRQFSSRILRYPAQVTLGALMSLAVVVCEWRIRKALRSDTGPDRRHQTSGGRDMRSAPGAVGVSGLAALVLLLPMEAGVAPWGD